MRKQIELDAVRLATSNIMHYVLTLFCTLSYLQTFKEHHASQLLRGQNDNLNRIIDERYGKQIIKLKYKAFHFFRYVIVYILVAFSHY